MNPEPNTPEKNNPPAQASSIPPLETDVAAKYIADQVQKARVSLHKSRLVGVVLCIVVLGYMTFLVKSLQAYLDPHQAADMANSFISEQVDDKAKDISDQLKDKIPAMIAQIPDYALEKIPEYRQALEDKVEADFTEFAHATSAQFGKHLDDFLKNHVVQIKALLDSAKDPDKLKALGPDLENEILEYLKEKPAEGESIKDKIDKSLDALKKMEAQMDRLANATDLTVQEKKTRRAIAMIAKTVDKNIEKPAKKEEK
jgi:uncharacterized protein YicC (UPF0701 family)